MADSPFTCLSLFSGVGTLDEGLRLALPGLRVCGYVEREAYAASVLLARMDDAALEFAPIWCGDIVEFPTEWCAGQVDFISAGFPCQPWSVAGARRGLDDERWLWPAIVRVLKDVRPQWVFLENVPGLLRGGLGPVLRDLAALGFDVEWTCLRASDVGAPHQRKRVFILAYREDADGRPGSALQAEIEKCWGRGLGSAGGELADAGSGPRVSGSGAAGRQARPHDGDVVERVADADGIGLKPGVGPPLGRESDAPRCGEVGDSPSVFGQAIERGQPDGTGRCVGVFPPGPKDRAAWAAVLAEQYDLAPALTQPEIRRLAHGFASGLDFRVARLRAAGNGCVPLQVAASFIRLAERMTR